MKTTAIIEMPAGTKDKIEIKDGIPMVDRTLDIEVPVAYGFIPNTLAEDGDPVDIFVLSSTKLKTNMETTVTVLGVFDCIDNGEEDHKLFGVIDKYLFTEDEIFQHVVNVGHYLLNYKAGFKVNGYSSIKDNSYLDKYKI